MKNELYYEGGWLFLLLGIPVVILLYWKYLQRRDASLTVSAIYGYATKKTLFSPPVLLLLLRLLAIFFVILAIANFRRVSTVTYKKKVAQADIILALDVSKSMLIEDIKPNRLEALKEVLSEFIAARVHDRIGIVLYAGESISLCPLTDDYPFLLKKLNEIDDNDFLDGTAIGIGLASSVSALQATKNKNKIIILLTDGENNAGFVDPLTAAEIAKKYSIKVYTIGIGKNGIEPFPVTDLNGNKTYKLIEVTINENMLKKIAALTGGSYFNATNNKGLSTIYSQINGLEKTKTVTVTEVKYDSEFRLFTLMAVFFLLLEFILKSTFLSTWPK